MSQFQTQKVPVIIASTLKPILDVRAFGKLALSLGETNTYRVFIIGFSAKRPISIPGFRFFSSMSHFNSGLDRIFAQLRFIFRLIQVRPKILICCTYELLPIASLLKPFFKFKIVYDVQENYTLNLNLNPSLSENGRKKAASLIQQAESVGSIDLYLFAEKCYAVEMPEKKPYLVLENKFKGELTKNSSIHLKEKRALRFCITGTITPAFGSLDAMIWFLEILKILPESKLIIAGHCPLNSFREILEKEAGETPNICLQLEPNPVDHEKLITVVKNSDLALLPYHDHPAIRNKMPTKLFECAALGVPVLISSNPIWEKFLAEFSGGYPIDFLNPAKAVEHLNAALDKTFFTSTPTENILWKTEKLHFQQAIKELIS
jgi:glycosyltransferase involved in cell wall biosynthesis